MQPIPLAVLKPPDIRLDGGIDRYCMQPITACGIENKKAPVLIAGSVLLL